MGKLITEAIASAVAARERIKLGKKNVNYD